MLHKRMAVTRQHIHVVHIHVQIHGIHRSHGIIRATHVHIVHGRRHTRVHWRHGTVHAWKTAHIVHLLNSTVVHANRRPQVWLHGQSVLCLYKWSIHRRLARLTVSHQHGNRHPPRGRKRVQVQTFLRSGPFQFISMILKPDFHLCRS